MAVPVPADRADIFAANRARGTIALAVAAAHGVTRRTRVHEAGSLRVRFPGPRSADLEAMIVNTAGGIAGGDRLAVDVAVGEAARLAVTTTAAEQIYRSLGPAATVQVNLTVAANGKLTWLPQETILFDSARLRRTIEVDLAEDATLVLAEALLFGRAAMGEVVEQGSLFDRWRVRRGGRLVFAETVRLDADIGTRLRQRAAAAGGGAVATLLVVPGDEARVAALRVAALRVAATWQGEVALSAWNGLAVARFVAREGSDLRHDLAAVLTALGVALPRLWPN
jgi:urease accessory protein